jgi:hypothetical protein
MLRLCCWIERTSSPDPRGITKSMYWSIVNKSLISSLVDTFLKKNKKSSSITKNQYQFCSKTSHLRFSNFGGKEKKGVQSAQYFDEDINHKTLFDAISQLRDD